MSPLADLDQGGFDRVREAAAALGAELDRLRAFEAAARTVLARGEAWFDHPIDPDGHEPVWTGDLVPADVMRALRAAVYGGEGGTP
ncbi:MAG: hypothetical protein DYG90_00785 [Chloroflexi bacterium CFX6]|nr:hypothetical protein [Chloroflexi bacterium CFX6]